MRSSAPLVPESAPSKDTIVIRGAREHNLKDISLDIPRGRFVVITGVSGSGKSTLAFDLLFAEGQRRFLDSMSAYARQFVTQLQRPDVDLISGLPPTVSIEQSTTRGGGKSTVATVTEIYHFIRLLYARIGTQYCPNCQVPVRPQDLKQIVSTLLEACKTRGTLQLLAPAIRNRKGNHLDIIRRLHYMDIDRMRIDGKLLESTENVRLDRFREHDIDAVVGVLQESGEILPDGTIDATLTRHRNRERKVRTLSEVVEHALSLGEGFMYALDAKGTTTIHSAIRACPLCLQSYPPLDPKNFSYNSSQGWCKTCRGFGETFELPDVKRGANGDSIEESWWRWTSTDTTCPDCLGSRLRVEARAVRLECAPATITSGKAMPKATSGDASGPTVDDIARMTVSQANAWIGDVVFSGRDAEISRDIVPEIRERLKFLEEVGLGYLQLGRAVPTLSGGESQRIRLAAQLGSNLSGVLYILDEPSIGLHSRDNDQLLATLQSLRTRGNSLVVVEHDEETMRHADHIIDLGPGAGVLGGSIVASGTLEELLRHPESVTGRCLREKPSYPSRGYRRPVLCLSTDKLESGSGHISASDVDTIESVSKNGRRKAPKAKITDDGTPSPTTPRAEADSGPYPDPQHCIVLQNVGINNLQNINVAFPMGRLVVVTGVSGSGKSTLVRECLLPAAEAVIVATGKGSRRRTDTPPEDDDDESPGKRSQSKTKTPKATVSIEELPFSITGANNIHAVHEVDQSPIGRTPRSTPATYVGFFDEIRRLFSNSNEARLRGYGVGRFSFNSSEGRCPDCTGSGYVKMEMSFLPTAHVRCETCQGRRFNPETLNVEWNGKSIADVLDLSVAEAIEFFANHQKILRPLLALRDTGLDYLRLGQTSPTLSGGEAQRIKLVSHLLTGLRPPKAMIPRSGPGGDAPMDASQPALHPKPALFLLEEPTIGLHIQDVQRLLGVLHRLVDAGHTVVVIEHNLDLIAEADWLIDLGPEAGEGGGRIVAQGPPESIAANPKSHTGRYLKPMLRLAQE